MLRRFTEFKSLHLHCPLRQIGKVSDLLVEEDSWAVRYLVISVDNTFPKRRVLISPAAIAGFDFDRNILATMLTSRQVIESPAVDLNQPICRQYEESLVDYYGWPVYWLGRFVQGSPDAIQRMADDTATMFVDDEKPSNLRSVRKLCGYQINSCDGIVGFLKDLVINTETWKVIYVIADESSWLIKESSTVPCEWIENVDWGKKRIDFTGRRRILKQKA